LYLLIEVHVLFASLPGRSGNHRAVTEATHWSRQRRIPA